MVAVEEVLKKLKTKARPDPVEGMARYGMLAEQRLARGRGKFVKEHTLALPLSF